MAYIEGEDRNQGTLFPVVLDDLVPDDHMCSVVDAFVGRLDMEKLGFERAQPAETGRPGYDPRSLLKLYLYGYVRVDLVNACSQENASAPDGRSCI